MASTIGVRYPFLYRRVTIVNGADRLTVSVSNGRDPQFVAKCKHKAFIDAPKFANAIDDCGLSQSNLDGRAIMIIKYGLHVHLLLRIHGVHHTSRNRSSECCSCPCCGRGSGIRGHRGCGSTASVDSLRPSDRGKHGEHEVLEAMSVGRSVHAVASKLVSTPDLHVLMTMTSPVSRWVSSVTRLRFDDLGICRSGNRMSASTPVAPYRWHWVAPWCSIDPHGRRGRITVNVHPAGKSLACSRHNFGDGEVEYCCLA